MGEYKTPYEFRLSFTPLDSERGHWEGERGESIFIPSDATEEIRKVKYELNRHNLKGIEYKDCIPDFSPISEDSVTIPNMSSDRDANFEQAYIAFAKKWNQIELDGKNDWTLESVRYWTRANKFTLHESNDMKTMFLVPTEIHDFFKHSGGVKECKVQEGQ